MTDIALHSRTTDGKPSHDTTVRPQTPRRSIPSGGGLVWDAKTLASRNLSGLTVEQLDCVPSSVEYLPGNHTVVRHRLGLTHPNAIACAHRLAQRHFKIVPPQEEAA